MIEFDLFAEAGVEAGVYSLLAVSSEGVARARTTISSSDTEIQQLLPRVAGKEKGAAIRETFGKILFHRVFSGDILAAWAKAAANDDGVRLRLIFDPPLSNLPWELLHDGRNFIATNANLAISRYIPVPEPRGRPVADKLKVLLVSASPGSLPPIPSKEIDQLATAIAGAAELQELRNCTVADLADAMAVGEYHVVHYLGHGAPGKLLLNGSTDEEVEPFADSALAQLLFGRRAIRLVLLSACNSAETGGSAFAGVGPALIRIGVPAVVAMQYEFVQLSTAQIFNQQLYKELSIGTPIDVAVNRSRNRISATGDLLNQRDWSTPVLYLGTRNGELITFRNKQADAVAKAAQAVQAAVLNNPVGRDAWRELQATFEQLRTSYQKLDILIQLNDLVREAKAQFDSVVHAAGRTLGGDEFREIKSEWERMRAGVLVRLEQASSGLDDTPLKDMIQLFLSQADIVSDAIRQKEYLRLEEEISKTDQMLIRHNTELARRVSNTIRDLVAASERTLGRISADD